MIALDTNILLRFITEDDAAQASAAQKLLNRKGETFFVGNIVLVETVWTLLRVYRFSREEVAIVLNDFLDRGDVSFENGEVVHHAVRAFEKGGDIADHLILETARNRGCSHLATFDDDLTNRFQDFALKP